MSRILAIADIHIHDYPQRNPSEKYRLYQTRVVAQNILNAAKQEGCDVLVIAGDVIDKWNPRPYVQAEVKGFLDTLMGYFREGYLIYGNHDQDNKSNNSDFIDSCLSVMLPPNLHYADKKEVIIDGCRIGFSNWRPEFDLSWVNGKLDVLFTHATISYSPTDSFHSQTLDENKFDLAICGDIHKPASIGKYVSIGVPQRCKMSDSDIASAIVYDCPSKQYKWVNLNPSNNLMMFNYTNVRDQEGWDQTKGIWNVYKPDNLSITGGLRDIKVPAWAEIDNLINGIINENGLTEIHNQVIHSIKDIDSKEVDFNFVITRFYCKNWRSIDEAELYFSDLDRVLITGENGAGKSSLLSAIKYAFLENRSIKDFLQFGAKDCVTEVEFLYQGSNFKIQRGFQGRGGFSKFWIDGEEQKYNNKTDLDEDIHNRFPFVDYMDIYFFDSDHHKLIGNITSERKSEIISKFFKMDKIDAFHEQAQYILEQTQRTTEKWRENIEKNAELLKYINDKLAILVLPQMNEQQLLENKNRGIEMQKAWQVYNSYMTTTAQLQARKNMLEEQINNLSSQCTSFRKKSVIEDEIKDYRGRVDWLQSTWNSLVSVKTEGKQLYLEWQNLGTSKVCPKCGQPIKNTEQFEHHKEELESRIHELMRQQSLIYESFSNVGLTKEAVDYGIASTVSEYNNRVAQLMTELNEQGRVSVEIDNLKVQLDIVYQDISNLGPIPPQVSLPEGFMEQMGRIENDLSVWNQYKSLTQDQYNANANIQSSQAELQKVADGVAGLQEYIKMTSPTGKIYEEIMNRLSQQFTDNQVKYVVERTTFRKKEHLDLASYYLNNGNEVSYQSCSSGQKTILDVNFLSKIVTRMGLLVMDEFLKHLDSKNHDICIEMLKEMNIGLILLSSHMESVPAFNNKSLNLELNESGITKLTCK